MTTQLLEARIENLEKRLRDVETRLQPEEVGHAHPRAGWRAFVGVDANNPDFEEAVRLGRKWRFADSPDGDPELS